LYQVKKVGVVPAQSINSSIGQAVRQVVFTDVANCRPIAVSDWLSIKQHCIGSKGLPGVQLQNSSDFKSYRRYISIYRKEDVLCQLKIRSDSEKFKKPAVALIKAKICQF
jgi:hypothetical protein